MTPSLFLGAELGTRLEGMRLRAFSITLLYGGPLGEESGWRLPPCHTYRRDTALLRASVILGYFWALWHAPLDISHAWGVTGFGGFVYRLICTIPITVLFKFFYNRGRGNILVAILLHTSADFGLDLFQIKTALSFGVFFLDGIGSCLLCRLFGENVAEAANFCP